MHEQSPVMTRARRSRDVPNIRSVSSSAGKCHKAQYGRLHSQLSLRATWVTDAGLAALAADDLMFLNLSETAVTDAGLMTLAGLNPSLPWTGAELG